MGRLTEHEKRNMEEISKILLIPQDEVEKTLILYIDKGIPEPQDLTSIEKGRVNLIRNSLSVQDLTYWAKTSEPESYQRELTIMLAHDFMC